MTSVIASMSTRGTTPAKVAVTLKEWESVQPVLGSPLHGIYLSDSPQVRRVADQIAERGMLRLTEARYGTEVRATSFVGRVSIGDISVTVQPKITGTPLTRLLSFGFGLRGLTRTGDRNTEFAHESDQPFHDLLIHQLVIEIRELVRRGLRREYTRVEHWLENPRGRIDVGRIAREGVSGRFFQTGAVPCVVYDRHGDTTLNQALIAGLALAAQLTDDVALRASLRYLDGKVEGAGVPHCSSRQTDLRGLLRRARRQQSRLTAAYGSALTLIELLNASAGPNLDDTTEEAILAPLPGFLFDMNLLFQAILFRFLSENLPAPFTVHGERRLHEGFAYAPSWNPRNRRAPTPRPDFAIVQEGKTILFLDAKYRDLWELPLPREMLYQLAIYALSLGDSSRGLRQAVILYPTMAAEASEARILVNNPAEKRQEPAMVVLRPVNLPKIATLISQRSLSARAAREELALCLVFGNESCPAVAQYGVEV